MVHKKVRKESGRVYNKFYDPENGMYNEQYWDDWNDYRDGWRGVNHDNTKLQPTDINTERWCDTSRKKYNSKIKMLLNRRKLRKQY